MANTKVTSAVIADGAITPSKIASGDFNFSDNLGVGTSSPVNLSGQTSLTINGSVARVDLQVSQTTTASVISESGYVHLQPASGGKAIIGNGATDLVVDSSGAVGINTSTIFGTTQISNTAWSAGAPYGTVLTVTGNNTNDANWGHLLISDSTTTTGNGGMIRFATGSSTSDMNPFAGIDGFTEGSAYGGLKFLTRPSGGTATERMRISSGGGVIVGGTATSGIFSVYGTTASAIELAFNTNNSSATIQSYSSSPLLLNPLGNNVQFGTSTAGGVGTTITKNANGSLIAMNQDYGNGYTQISFRYNGTQVGQIYSSTSTTTYATSSDYRLKENINYDFNALERVTQLKPARFNFIADADTTVDGFLAHEVQDIVPEAIHGVKDEMQEEEYEVTPAELDEEGNVVTEAVMGTREVPKYQGIDQSKLVPLLTKAIQEQQTIIDDLKARIETLENA